ncbi:hypothetical protein B9Z65_7776 [Elsinoe australis]|uniref:Uncharacterized protein n=1 Tax=Elsinoe australis TaxID=40998 RepID=A0A2P8A0I1_9PEZI|nr:hypothetical protein B9Z65_7776 [Elsinoe australis]
MQSKRKFDAESGQVYDEIIVGVSQSSKKRRRKLTAKDLRARPPENLTWLYRYRGSGITVSPATGPVPSLASQAARCLIENLHRLDDGAIEAIPEHLLEIVAKAARNSEMVGLRALQLFGPKVGGPRLLKSVRVPMERPEKKASAYGNQDAILSLNHSTVHEASVRLDWDPLRCTASAQLIRHPAGAPILHSLGTMENLTTLYLQECSWPETSDQIDDTFARRLAQRVTEANHFPALRTLIIEETAIQLSSKFFESLHDIPTLQLLCVKSAASVTSVWTKSYPQVYPGSPGWTHIKSDEVFGPEPRSGPSYSDSLDGFLQSSVSGRDTCLADTSMMTEGARDSLIPCCSDFVQKSASKTGSILPNIHVIFNTDAMKRPGRISDDIDKVHVFVRDREWKSEQAIQHGTGERKQVEDTKVPRKIRTTAARHLRGDLNDLMGL